MSRSNSTLPPEDETLLTEILEAATPAVAVAGERTRADLETDWMFAAAIERTLEIIGEAASKVSAHSRKLCPEIPWREMIGMRHRLIHGYASVDHDIVWDVVVLDLPLLIDRLRERLPSPDGS